MHKYHYYTNNDQYTLLHIVILFLYLHTRTYLLRPPSNVAVQYVDTLLMREVKLGKDFGKLGPLFWASEHGPSLFSKASAALGIPGLADMDAQTRHDILSLGNATAPTPSCSAPGTTKCEACAGGCQLQNTIPYDLGIANERTHLVAPNKSFDTLLYRAQNHVLWASTRPLDVTGTASQLDWSPVAPTDIPNDNSNINAGTLPNGSNVVSVQALGRRFQRGDCARFCCSFAISFLCRARFYFHF